MADPIHVEPAAESLVPDGNPYKPSALGVASGQSIVRLVVRPLCVTAIVSLPAMASLVVAWWCINDRWWLDTVGWTFLFYVQATLLGVFYAGAVVTLAMPKQRLVALLCLVPLTLLYVFVTVGGWYAVSMSFLDF